MSYESLIKERQYSPSFRDKGRDDVVLLDVFPVHDGEEITVIFESVSSQARQGVWMKTDNGIIVNGLLCPSTDLWQDHAPPEVLCRCLTSDGILTVYNIWDRGDGRQSQGWTSGMLIEELPDGRRYRCNDSGFDTLFDKLVFRIERGR